MSRSGSEVLALIRSRVDLRFALDADRFAELLIGRARQSGRDDDVAGWLRSLSLDDLYLAQACVMRDERAWEECARAHFGFMREFAGRFLRASDAAEVCDRVIADLWEKEKLGQYEGRSSLRTWLGTVVANAAIQAGKRIRRRDADAGPDAIATAPTAADPPEDREAARILADVTSEAIQALPRDDKLVLLLHYEQNLSLDQMAPLLNTSKATLSRRLKRLREDIRATVERMAFDRFRSSMADVRSRLDLGRIDLDLGTLLSTSGAVKGHDGHGV